MPPTQCQEARDAIEKMDEALTRLRTEALDTYNSDAYKRGEGDARERYRGQRQKYYNLKAVIDALKAATIVYGRTGDELGNTNKRTDPPTITLNDTWKGTRDAVVAQILAHEAMHILARSRGNSIDQEIRCRRKEMEVWELLKGTTHHALDLPCDNEQRAFAQGEDHVRTILRGLYRGVPEHDQPPEEGDKSTGGTGKPDAGGVPPKKKRKRGRIKIERARNVPLSGDPFDAVFDFVDEAAAALTGSALTDAWYAFDVRVPHGYSAQETTGLHQNFRGLLCAAEVPGPEGFAATLGIIEEPDVLHGGEWPGFSEKAQYRLDAATFNAEVLDVRPETLVDLETEVDGAPARVIELAYDRFHRPDPERWRLRMRERVVYTRCEETLYSISLLCEATEWHRHELAFERMVESFRFR